MKSFNTQLLFNILSKKFNTSKIKKNKKNSSRIFFIEKLIDAKSNIHLFVINFPNYFTNENSILKAFKELDKKEKIIDIYLYVPSEQVLKEIEEYIIYKKKNSYYIRNRNLLKIIDKRFQYLNIKVIVYNQFYKFGVSAIDLNTDISFLHLSKVNRRELIEHASYFNLYYNESNKAIFQIIENFFKMIEKTGKNIKEIK